MTNQWNNDHKVLTSLLLDSPSNVLPFLFFPPPNSSIYEWPCLGWLTPRYREQPMAAGHSYPIPSWLKNHLTCSSFTRAGKAVDLCATLKAPSRTLTVADHRGHVMRAARGSLCACGDSGRMRCCSARLGTVELVMI